MAEEHRKNDDEVIDFSRLKKSFKDFFKAKKELQAPSQETASHTQRTPFSPEIALPSQHANKKADDAISVDFSQVKAFAKKHARWLVPLICILIALSVSIYLRTIPF